MCMGKVASTIGGGLLGGLSGAVIGNKLGKKKNGAPGAPSSDTGPYVAATPGTSPSIGG